MNLMEEMKINAGFEINEEINLKAAFKKIKQKADVFFKDLDDMEEADDAYKQFSKVINSDLKIYSRMLKREIKNPRNDRSSVNRKNIKQIEKYIKELNYMLKDITKINGFGDSSKVRPAIDAALTKRWNRMWAGNVPGNFNESMDQDGGGGHYDDGEQAGSEKRTEKKLKPFKNLKINGKKIGSENNILTIDGKKFGEIIYEEPAKIWYVSGNKYPETSKTFNGLVKKLMGLTFKKKGK